MIPIVALPPAGGGFTYSDPNITASRFIQTPSLVSRMLQDFAQLRYVGATLLKGRQKAIGGAIMYELVAGIFADGSTEPVAPGSNYVRSTVSLGAAALAKTQKSGVDYPILDEALDAYKFNPLVVSAQKAVNSAARQIDQTVLAAISSAVTTSVAATGLWNGSGTTPNILKDALLAASTVTNQNLGYNPDTLLIDDSLWVSLASNTALQTAMARESSSNAVYTGDFPTLAGLQVVHIPTANMPGGAGTAAWVFDSTQLGFIATQDLGGGYSSAGELIEQKTIRDEDIDGWRLRVRTNFVPVVNNPLAGCKITAAA